MMLLGTAGGLSFQYSVNINNQQAPTNTTIDGKIRFNNPTIADSISLYISTQTHSFK